MASTYQFVMAGTLLICSHISECRRSLLYKTDDALLIDLFHLRVCGIPSYCS
jgi:hypothetical protein